MNKDDLTEYETWVRLHAYGRAATHGAAAASILASIDVVELTEEACARCRAPFPEPIRTLDSIHLATADFLRTRGLVVEISSYDERMRQAARSIGFGLVTGDD